MPDSTELWSWDGAVWSRLPGAGPTARSASAAVYDTQRDRLMLWGGWVGKQGGLRNDTWEWDGARWRAGSDSTPRPRGHFAMAYDEARGVTLMFGGDDRSGPAWPSNSWSWNGINWRQVATAGPPGRAVTAMAYDSKHKVVLLFGGVGLSPAEGQPQPSFGDTWVWNGQSWLQRAVTGPSPRNRHAMTFDRRAGVVLLYGGNSGGRAGMSEEHGDMWQWDGEHWTEIPLTGPTPGPRSLHAMAYDAARGVTVLYGGSSNGELMSDTWEWDGHRWQRIIPR